MSFSTSSSDGTVSSGFTQSLWIGLAAILVLIAVLYVTRAITRRCFWCCIEDKQRSRNSSVILSDNDADLMGVDEKHAPHQKNTTAPLTGPKALVSTTTYGATDAAVPSSTPNQQASFAPVGGAGYQKYTMANAGSAASCGSAGGAACTPLTHPYNVHQGESSGETTARAEPFFCASARLIRNLPLPVCSEEREVSLPVSFLSEPQDADELEEEFRGSAPSQLAEQRSEESVEIYVVPPPSDTELASSASVGESRIKKLQSLSINANSTSKCATQNSVSQPGACVRTSKSSSFATPEQLARTPPPQPTTALSASSPIVPAVPSQVSQENERPLEDGRASKNCGTTHTCSRDTASFTNTLHFGDREEGGESVTTELEKLQQNLQNQRDELTRTQAELSAVVAAKAAVEAERQRICDEVQDMERYKGTLDGIIAFTLRELEDAAAGVEEAEEQMRRECAVASKKMAAAQEELRVRSLLA